jgi:hypothetical protein
MPQTTEGGLQPTHQPDFTEHRPHFRCNREQRGSKRKTDFLIRSRPRHPNSYHQRNTTIQKAQVNAILFSNKRFSGKIEVCNS